MLFKSFVSLALTSAVTANGAADALPWASANPFAAAAANAYADAFAEAEAIGHPDPDAYALAASADDCASVGCHAACGYLILDGAACSQNSTDSYSGPFNTTCLCDADSKFMKRYPSCMECGWTLWKYYGPYVEEALAACSTLSTEPTGTLRCSTTLSESYTKDANAGCAFGGACLSTSGSEVLTSSGASFVIANSTTSAGNSSSVVVASTSDTSGSAASSAASGSGSGSPSGSASASASGASASATSTGAGAKLAIGSSIFGAAMLALLA